MERIIIVCEGETERDFCNVVLAPAFNTKEIYIQAPIIKKSKGGIVKWEALRKQIETHLAEETTTIVTTLIDYYGLQKKHLFPAWEKSLTLADKNSRVEVIEQGMAGDINNKRFIPYLQLHEFEGLLFNNIEVFQQMFPAEELVGIKELHEVFRKFDNPEMINDQKETAPSERLKRIIPGYNKVLYGNMLAEAIGLHNIRRKSPRFNAWLTLLETTKAV